MPSDEMDLFPTREDVLTGMPGKRAATALSLIESRTAYLAQRSRRDMDALPPDAGGPDREDEFLQAFRESAAPRVSVTIQQIEQWASGWAVLVPDNPQVRAALVHLLGEKYRFTAGAIPGMRAALGLADPALDDAYRRLYGAPLTSVYAPSIPLSARPAWLWERMSAWLEGLHPFWLAFALTLPVGPGLMALPIALARVGPAISLVLIAVFMLVNMITVGALAEAIARSGITRYGQGYLGQMVDDWLGRAGSIFVTFSFAMDGVLILPVFYLGIATTLAQASGLGTPIWVAAIFLIDLFFLSRRTLNTTVASTLVIITINVCVLIAIPLITLTHFSAAQLTHHVPALGLTAVQLIFGTMLSNYFSHQIMANYGRVVLRRDPGARHWIRGSLAAIVATAIISALWILSVDGSLTPTILEHERGTIVAALGANVTRVISFLGSLLVILSLGMTTIHISIALLFSTKERLPYRIREHPQLGLILPMLPVAAIFLLTEWLAVTGVVSFAGLLGFVTVMTLTTLGAFFPILLALAGRRKSDVALIGFRGLLGSEPVLAALYILFLATMYAYGLVIWSTLLEKGITLLAAVAITAGTVQVLRRGMLDTRTVVEVRDDENTGSPPSYAVLHAGRPMPVTATVEDGAEPQRSAAEGSLPSLSRLRAVHFGLPASDATEIKIWVHRVTSIGESIGIPATVTMTNGDDSRLVDLGLSNGWAVLPIGPAATQVSIRLRPAEDAPSHMAGQRVGGDIGGKS
jgi:hypothetical protein